MMAVIDRIGQTESFTLRLIPDDGTGEGRTLAEFATLVQSGGNPGSPRNYTIMCSGFDYMRKEVKFTVLAAPRVTTSD